MGEPEGVRPFLDEALLPNRTAVLSPSRYRLPLGPYLGRQRLAIASDFPGTMTDAVRYSSISVDTVATHVSFLFGAMPSCSFATPLPDWSIGLEMQFYLVFPFLMLAVSRFGYLGMISAILGCVEVGSLGASNFYHSFPMPSFLPLRLHLFLLGMLLQQQFMARPSAACGHL
jgi:peptidoglycan/LPS O-acetylase OafA/YrhL